MASHMVDRHHQTISNYPNRLPTYWKVDVTRVNGHNSQWQCGNSRCSSRKIMGNFEWKIKQFNRKNGICLNKYHQHIFCLLFRHKLEPISRFFFCIFFLIFVCIFLCLHLIIYYCMLFFATCRKQQGLTNLNAIITKIGVFVKMILIWYCCYDSYLSLWGGFKENDDTFGYH